MSWNPEFLRMLEGAEQRNRLRKIDRSIARDTTERPYPSSDTDQDAPAEPDADERPDWEEGILEELEGA